MVHIHVLPIVMSHEVYNRNKEIITGSNRKNIKSEIRRRYFKSVRDSLCHRCVLDPSKYATPCTSSLS